MRCKHCDPDSAAKACSRCSRLLPKLTRAHEVLKPDEVSLQTVTKALSKVDLKSLRARRQDELSAVWEALIKAAPSMGSIPGFKSSKVGVSWEQDEIDEWEEYLETPVEHDGDGGYDFELPLPCGSKYERKGNSHYVDGNRLQGPLPSLDLAEMLTLQYSDTTPVDFASWNDLLSGLASASWTISEVLSLGWVQQRIYPSAPPILAESLREGMLEFEGGFGHFYTGTGMHPFWHFASSTINDVSKTLAESTTLTPSQWVRLEYVLGSIAFAWRETFDECGTDCRQAQYLPSLVVMHDRLHLLTRSPQGFVTTRIPADPEIWRAVVAWALYPPNSEIGHYLRAIQWLLMQDREDEEVAPLPETRALEFLGTIWRNLGDAVSVTINDNFAVQGESGLAYRIGISASRTEWDTGVTAYRDMRAAKAEKNGIPVCIQLNAHQPGLPLGDRLGSFLLALRGDTSTANSISTLHDLHSIWLRANQSAKRWDRIAGMYPNGFVEQDEEEWDEDWMDEEWDEEEEELEDDEPISQPIPVEVAATEEGESEQLDQLVWRLDQIWNERMEG